MATTVTMRSLLEAGIHFGHQTRRWNPKMARFIFGERHGIYIIDLQKTLRQLHKAYVAVRDTTARGGHILFVGTKKQARETVEREAKRCGMYYVNQRWLGGTLTNWETIQKSIRNLVRLEELESTGRIEQFPKKEAIKMRKEREKLFRNLCGIKDMPGLPHLLFVVDSHREEIAVREAARLGVPCVAIVDTNADPDAVPIPIPGNDDAIRAISLFCSIIADAAIEGRSTYEKNKEAEEARTRAMLKTGGAARSEKVARQQKKYAEDEAPGETQSGPEAAEPLDVTMAEEAVEGVEA